MDYLLIIYGFVKKKGERIDHTIHRVKEIKELLSKTERDNLLKYIYIYTVIISKQMGNLACPNERINFIELLRKKYFRIISI